jgi:hypothetical protein
MSPTLRQGRLQGEQLLKELLVTSFPYVRMRIEDVLDFLPNIEKDEEDLVLDAETVSTSDAEDVDN